MKSLDAQELLQLAQDRTGLSDFGPEDLREGLDMLVKGVNADVVVRPDRVAHPRENILRLPARQPSKKRSGENHDQDLGTNHVRLHSTRALVPR